MVQTSDVIVIGAGMAGVSLAGRLAQHAKVTILEAQPGPGTQATGRSAALLVCNYGNAVLRRINALAGSFLADPAELGERSFLTPRGMLFFAGIGDIATFESELARGDGLERISSSDAVKMVPILRPDAVAAACLEPDAQDIDVDRMLNGFLRAARGHGAVLVNNAEVTAINRTSNWQVEAGGNRYEAPIVVNAAGAWADQVALMAGVAPLGLRALRRSAALLPVPDDYDITHWPMMEPITESWYAKPVSGKLMVSPADADPVAPMDAWPDDMVLAEGLDRFERSVTMPVTRVSHSWAGLRTFAPDDTPAVGFADQQDGFFWLAGQGGYGIQTAPVLSQLSCDLLRGITPSIAADLIVSLDPNRFTKDSL
ncbi:NAD(P)/FAD-dependent oxidoreductase [Pelagimonas varians]|uniref:Hydrogen cyanide synthase subunit HcnC n=1 Tax=Pelagimonas varians TaxID=696760 RepID=A0A238K373_9RHOB|nr:FAD-binding oxidoreductase [Pelagimonas varians]PYG33335.1 D-arginine dehydrogenase [Pelagimonas varians]SMX36396.1 Hydrogen cyanide synthase subunit HcnC precursor [Pelagimonas varians]